MGVSRITYRPELNRTWTLHPRGRAFLDSMDRKVIDRFFDVVIKDVLSGGGDVHLAVFLATPQSLGCFVDKSRCSRHMGLFGTDHLSMAVFPIQQDVERYVLNPDSYFFSDIHRNTDPLVIREIAAAIYVHPERAEDLVYVTSLRMVPNKIQGGVLFKRSVEKYEGYEDYLDYDPNRFR